MPALVPVERSGCGDEPDWSPLLDIAWGAMSNRGLISAFWEAMQAKDWGRAAGYLAPECVIDWQCSGERIVGRTDFAALQAS
ncbi:MAG: nuclear transport factor 2-like protein [Acidimicrobiales bacterium]